MLVNMRKNSYNYKSLSRGANPSPDVPAAGAAPIPTPRPAPTGEVAERSKAAVLKTVEGLRLPRVRIPASPPTKPHAASSEPRRLRLPGSAPDPDETADQQQRMTPSPLISADDLAARLRNPSTRIFDCRFSLKDPGRGPRVYAEEHVPGAVYASLDRDLSDLSVTGAGRHPLPDRESFTRWMEQCGVGDDTTVVAYDDAGGVFAARLWWLARWAGLEDCRVLDGGLDAWLRQGFELDTAIPSYPEGRITRRDPPVAVCGIDKVLAASEGHEDLVVLDAREAARFRGEVEPLDPVAGHIPRSRNAPSSGNLDAFGRFLPAEALRERFAPFIADGDASRIVHSCGSGVTACHNLLAMEIAGLAGSRLYPGSWSQWVDDPGRPVATGEER